MGLYKIKFKESAERDIRKITHSLIPNIVRKIDLLASNPLPIQSLKLSGVERIYRIRIGSYRVIYEVNDEIKIIIIHYIRHRRKSIVNCKIGR